MFMRMFLGVLELFFTIYRKLTTLCQRKMDIAQDIVLITGAGSGIGREMALQFSREGSRVVLWDVNTSGNEETAKMVKDQGGEAFPYQCDVTNRQQVYETAERVKEEVGKVSILVNNAGIVSGKRLMDIPDEKIIKTFEVNSVSHFWTCKAFLPGMMEDNYGHVVTIASVAGLIGGVNLTDYCASKFAAVGFHESLTRELEQEGYNGISTTVICPVFINTGMFEGAQTLSAISILDPKSVAKKVVDAVCTKREVVIIPNNVTLLITLKHILPTCLYVRLLRCVGADTMMSGFVGRDGEKASSKGSS